MNCRVISSRVKVIISNKEHQECSNQSQIHRPSSFNPSQVTSYYSHLLSQQETMGPSHLLALQIDLKLNSKVSFISRKHRRDQARTSTVTLEAATGLALLVV